MLARNIEALCRRRAREARAATIEERVAAAVTRFTGRMNFVYLQLVLLVAAITEKMGVETEIDHELEEIKHDVAPDAVLDHIEEKSA